MGVLKDSATKLLVSSVVLSGITSTPEALTNNPEPGYVTEIDGFFGSGTRKAVILYQQAHNLKVDGIAGAETIGQILSDQEKESFSSEQKTTSYETTTTENTSYDNERESDQSISRNVIDTAKNLKGSPYRWGGTSPSGFDCSGFLQYVFKEHGKSVPRKVSDIWKTAGSVSSLKKGDLVFFSTYKLGPSHVGIYLGNQTFIHSGSSTGVTISNMDSSYWGPRFIGAKRL
ncbi:C40 family peptidase [Bacillus sp. FJAT-45350]|uniref:C40 family peptidase n=1 Tax=Bacillus sp. FJAT-45350 TaxID=2011014 RepID=UPI000BB77F29|nr:NlpC/P60 family protein [Bacillus sp. FJAT-45350]